VPEPFPLAADTEVLAASELKIACQLMRLGLAENSRETAERLGCDPAGTLAGRVRLAEDRAAAAVWVLVVDGAHGTDPTPIGVTASLRHRRHISTTTPPNWKWTPCRTAWPAVTSHTSTPCNCRATTPCRRDNRSAKSSAPTGYAHWPWRTCLFGPRS
jgi:hypothetical protein